VDIELFRKQTREAFCFKAGLLLIWLKHNPIQLFPELPPALAGG